MSAWVTAVMLTMMMKRDNANETRNSMAMTSAKVNQEQRVEIGGEPP
jgi:hypothetical protein